MNSVRIPVALMATLTFAATPIFAAGLLNLPASPVIVSHGEWNTGATSTIDITLSSVPAGSPPGYHVWNGTFAGWCIEDNLQPDAPAGSSLAPLDSTDAIPLSCSPGDYPGIPWDQVNYLLNHPQALPPLQSRKLDGAHTQL